jgi:integron integrase
MNMAIRNRSRRGDPHRHGIPHSAGVKSQLLRDLRRAIRTRNYSIRTEHAYVDWVYRYILFHDKRHPRAMGPPEINAFLSHLACDLNVAASTQNQALSGILFLYRHVLKREIGDLGEVVRAKKPAKVPVVLSAQEVQAVLSRLRGTRRLMVLLLYGTGMRKIELVRLRVKDVDFSQRCIVVRSGKGQKDRIVPLPRCTEAGLREQIRRVKLLHTHDLEAGYGTVHLPYALARKYPNTEKEFHWQYVFPSPKLSIDPRSGRKQRHHVYDSVLQADVRNAARQAGVQKDVHAHTFRHSYATALLGSGADIRTVQESLGHKDVKTTMIYTHILNNSAAAIDSPADSLAEASALWPSPSVGNATRGVAGLRDLLDVLMRTIGPLAEVSHMWACK